MSVMRSGQGPVAPFTAASVTCLSCSGVRPKLQVTVLPLALPLFAMAHGPASTLSASATAVCCRGQHGGRERDRREESGARHGFGDGAACGGPQFTVLSAAVPLFAMPQLPVVTLVPACAPGFVAGVAGVADAADAAGAVQQCRN